MATDKPRYSVTVDDKLFEEIEKFRFDNRFQSRAEATVDLIQKGLIALKSNKMESNILDKLFPEHPHIGGLDESGDFVDEFSKEDSLEIIRDMAKLPKEAIGDLKVIFEFLDFKYNKKE